MGKFAKAKKIGTVSEKSRAARRANSPSLQLDKSLKELKAPVGSSDYTSNTLGAKDAGIVKKKTPTKRVTRAQRLRHEKGLERADRNVDVLETKRSKSFVKEKRTKDRAGEWADLNKKYTDGIPKSSNLFQNLQQDDDDDDEDSMSDDGPGELKTANKATMSANNRSRFDSLPEGPAAAAALDVPAVPAPDVAVVDEDDIDEVL